MKKVFGFILAAVFTFSLVACNTVQDTSINWDVISDDLVIDTSTPVTINFWHTMGKDSGQRVLDEFIQEFKVLYPHVTINHLQQSGYEGLKSAINQALPAGNEPHLSYSYTDHVAAYLNSGLVLPMNNLINNKNPEIGLSQTEIADFVDGYWAEGKVYDAKGSILNMPFIKSTEVMFYNKTFFTQNNLTVPQTWDQVKSTSQTIRTLIDNSTTLTAEQKTATVPFGYDSEDNLFITALAQKNIPYTGFNTQTGQGEILFNNDAAKETVEFFDGLVQDKLFTSKGLLGGANTSNKFKDGQLFMSVGSTGGTGYNVPNAGTFEAEVAPIPQFDLNNQKVIQQGPNINMFLKENVQEMVAAWLFLKYITQPAQSARFSIVSGYSPVRKSSYTTEEYLAYEEFLATNPNATPTQKLIGKTLKLSGAQVNNYFTSPAFDRSSKAREEVGNLLVNVFGGVSSVQDAFNKAYEETMF